MLDFIPSNRRRFAYLFGVGYTQSPRSHKASSGGQSSDAAFLSRRMSDRKRAERSVAKKGVLVSAVVLISALITFALVADNTTVRVGMALLAVIAGSALVDFLFKRGISYAETSTQGQQERRFLKIGFVVVPLFLGCASLLVSLEPDSATVRLGLAILSLAGAFSLVRLARHDALDNSYSVLVAPIVQILLWMCGAVGVGLCAYLLWPLISS